MKRRLAEFHIDIPFRQTTDVSQNLFVICMSTRCVFKRFHSKPMVQTCDVKCNTLQCNAHVDSSEAKGSNWLLF